MFIPLSAFTAVAPPRMSIAVTITADRTKHDFQSTCWHHIHVCRCIRQEDITSIGVAGLLANLPRPRERPKTMKEQRGRRT